MRMNRKAALAAGASLGIALLSACSDSPTAPSKAAAFIPKSSFALNDLTTSTPVAGQLTICKAGNIGGTFTVTFTAGQGGAGVPSAQNPITVANGECRVAGLDAGDASQSKGDFFHVTENAAADPANTTQVLTSCVDLSGPTPCANFANNYFINNVHGVTLTYTNTFTEPPPPPSGCTFTKGWYQSKNATITGVDGLSVDVETAFFAAQPNKTGSVSFVGPNNLLNLYQQLLAALENGGAGGPQAVQDAIAAAQAGTTVTGTVLTTSLSNTDISNLINTLTAFNEGTFPNWPHC
jgi:hypothetical protein